MSKQTARFGNAALTLALLLAAGPSPNALSGIRTALELINKQPSRLAIPARLH
jgi:hypothetical protein